MNLRLYFLLLFCMIFSINVQAQMDKEELDSLFKVERNFEKLRAASLLYLKNKPENDISSRANNNEEENEFEQEANFFHRWAWFNADRLDAAGNLTNYAEKTNAALEQRNSTYTSNLTNSSNSNWTSIGPANYTTPTLTIDGLARMDCIAFHPTDPNIMYSGSAMGGIWKTTNGGGFWQLCNGFFAYNGVSGIVVNKFNGDELWAICGTGESRNLWGIFDSQSGCRVYHSTDAGFTWQPTKDIPNYTNLVAGNIVQDAFSPSTLYIATSAGIYKTIDGGQNWINGNAGFGTSFYRSVEINPVTNRLYAEGPGILKYSENGSMVTSQNMLLNTGLPTAVNRSSLAISPSNSLIVYLLCGPAYTGSFYGLYKSVDGGANFIQQSTTPNIFDTETNGAGGFNQTNYDNCIAVSATDVNSILTGGAAIWQSFDAGVTMTFNTYYWNNAVEPWRYVHPDIHAIKLNPLNNKVFACTDGGVYVSTDFGVHWGPSYNGAAAAQIFHLNTYKNNSTMNTFGSQDNGIKIRKNNGLYQQFAGGDGYSSDFDQNDSSILYSSTNKSVIKYTNFGNSVGVDVTPFRRDTFPNGNSSPYVWFPLVKTAIGPGSSNILFVGYESVMKSINGGISWSSTGKPGYWDIVQAPSSPSIIYAAGGNAYSGTGGIGLNRSNNYGTIGSWTNILSTLGSWNQRIMSIAVDPVNANSIAICFGGYSIGVKVFTTTYNTVNNTAVWTNMSYNLPNTPVSSLAMDNNSNLYAGTDVGVFVLPSGSTTWVEFYNGLPIIPVTQLRINSVAQTITASTFGAGIYVGNLYGSCPVNLLVVGTQAGNITYEASDFINTNAVTMSGGATSKVVLRSGNKIIFTPGCDLKDGTLRAVIGACGEAFPPISLINNAPPQNDSVKQKQQILLPNAKNININEPINNK